MSKNNSKWMVKYTDGQIAGPYNQTEIIDFIHKGQLTGTEKVSEYPGGLWQNLSKCPPFYEALLSALANPLIPHPDKESPDEDLENAPEVENIDVTPSTDHSEKPLIESISAEDIVSDHSGQILNSSSRKKNGLDKDLLDSEASEKTETPEQKPSVLSSQDIDFKDVHHSPYASQVSHNSNMPLPKNQQLLAQDFPKNETQQMIQEKPPGKKKQKKKSSRSISKLLFLCCFISVAYLVLDEGEEEEKTQRVSLIFPSKFDIGKVSEDKLKERFQKILKLFYTSTYKGYVQAQEQLVQLAEDASDVPDILGQLCLTHRELWPYSQKTSEDRIAITQLSQRISQVQAIGIHQNLCLIVKHLLSDQIEMASNITNNALKNYSEIPVLYDIKAEILARSGQYDEAIAYIQKAQSMAKQNTWTHWLKLYIREAQYQIDQKLSINQKPPIAVAETLRQIHTQNPSHIFTMVLLGYLDLTVLENHQQGIQRITQGLKSNEILLLPDIYSRVTLALSRYYISQKNNKMALNFAQKSYEKDPLNLKSKEIILSIGGQEALQALHTTESQLIALGDFFYEKKKFAEAQAQYKAAFEQNPKNAMAALRAGQSLWELNFRTESVTWMKKALVADPQMIDVYVALSDILSQKYQFDMAMAFLLRGIRKTSQNYKLLKSVALVELRRQNYKGAISFAKKALKLYDTDIETNMILAQGLYHLDKYQEAYQIMAKAIELVGVDAKIQSFYAKVIAALQGREFGEKYILPLINTYPDQPDYKIALAEIYFMDHEYQKAEAILNEIVIRDPRNKKAQVLLGDIYRQMPDREINKALKAYLNAAIADPVDAKPLFQVGVIYMEAQRYTEAIPQFETVLKINDKYPRAYFYQGQAYLQLGQTNEALQAAKKEKQINPNLAESYLLAGDTYMKTGHYAKAIAEYQRAIKIRPQGGQIYISLAQAYRLSNNFDVAEKMIAQAEKLSGANPLIYKEQGEIYEQKGQVQRAIAVYERYIQTAPNAYDKKIIESKILKLSQQ